MIPAEHWQRIDAFDERADRAADAMRGYQPVDKFFYALTETANHSILWHAINIVMVVTRRHSPRDALCLAAVLGAESALVNGGVKKLFNRERPVHVEARPHRLRTPKTTSFPSGHATSAFCAAVVLSRGRRAPVKAGWLTLASLVAYSRMHVRVHHASDVAGGTLIGLLLGAVANRLTPTRRG